MKKLLLSIISLALLNSFQPIICMEQMEKEKAGFINSAKLEDLAPELKLSILQHIIISKIESNNIFDPLKGVLELINTAISINKRDFRILKNDLVLFAYQYIKDFFAPDESKLSKKELEQELNNALKTLNKKAPISAKLIHKKKIAKLLISEANPNLPINSYSQQPNLLFHLIEADKNTGEVLVCISIDNHTRQIISLLIFFGFAINAKDALGRSPLWHAIKRWNKEMVDLLLEHDASVDKSIHDLAFQQALTFSDPREIAEMIHAKFQQTTLSHEPEPNSPKRRCILS